MSRTIEDQLAALGEAVDVAMASEELRRFDDDPVEFDVEFDQDVVVLDDRRRRRFTLVAVAAAIVLIVGSIALLGRDFDNSSPVIADQPETESFVVTDPLNVDLAELVAQSSQRRISEIGDVLTLDWEALPAGWEVDVDGAALSSDPFGISGTEYVQTAQIHTSENIRLSVRIGGFLEEGRGAPFSVTPGASTVDVRGQVAQLSLGSIEWIESEQLLVTISGPPVAELEPVYLSAAEALVPVLAPLQFEAVNEADFQSFPTTPLDSEPVLAGSLNNVEWSIVTGDQNSLLELSVDGRLLGGLPNQVPLDPTSVLITIDPLPGGVVLFASAPALGHSVVFRTESGQVSLPVVSFGEDLTAFAVPIDDRLDPVEVELLDADGESLGAFSLGNLSPYSGGSIGTGFQIDQ